ncbi:NAD(P)-dependent alcohol dehydrogenase [Novosphingobium sp. P6W]|uniref:NAD(P)-dependent alcohol dehydrogenase n=1 Tax=Novosphingobium sp. P6W TaxID=1609758 RepID=UPI0005C2FC19|nr:NAD(P)-dependent alcohol dehydrogenase [Novosphingobium sp. P6W]AXB79606.1 NAD(P)-dependent alcohol dehydrogenase [Novosphingobium sp. P6W]KIS34341.1 geraniol dehydrogenase [Novosphingobium sp. P6W]
MHTTAAIAREAYGDFTIEPVDLAEPRAGEVRVRIAGVGLCHTDLIARDQFIPIRLPAVLGHEGSGIVDAVGEGVSKVTVGDRVVLGFSSCGHCPRCEEHLPSYCREFPALNYAGARGDGTTAISIDGAPVSANFFGQSSFAAHAVTHERNLVRIEAQDVPLELLGPLGCGFQTGAGGVMRSLACPAGSSIAIFGGGPVGLAAVMGAVVQECATIILVEPFAARRAMALELGATHVIDPAQGEVGAAIRTILPDGVEFAFETSGREAVVETALASLSSHGLLGLVGVPPRPESSLSINLASLITYGHRIHGIVEGDSDLQTFIPQLVELYREGRFPFDSLIRTYPLAQINEAVAAQLSGECIKAVLIP